MNSMVQIIGIFLLFLTVFDQTLGENQQGDIEHHVHQKAHHNSHNRRHYRNNEEKHHHHLLRHHKGWKAREADSEICEKICDVELLTVSKWLNGTKELHFLYQIVPPSIKKAITDVIKHNTGATTSNPQTTTPTSGSTTLGDNGLFPKSLFNGSLPVDLDKLYNATENWPILSYFARLFAHFLSYAHGLSQIFSACPEFANVWKIIIHALAGQCSRMEFFLDNLRELFGFNGPVGGNLTNLTYWEHIFPPIGVLEGLEHAIKFPNLTNLVG